MSEQSGVETVRVKLPTAFDPTKHLVAVEKKIVETHGDGFQIVSIDGAKGGERFAVAERREGVTQVFSSTNKRKTVTLGKNVKSSDGDRQAAILQENNPGYYLTKFEPFLYRAELTKLSPDEVRCREAIALVIGCKPWDVSVASRLDGGFEVGLPAHKYQPRHNEKIEEVATHVVGEDGWYVKVNARQLTASLIPSKPPTFPSAIGTPMKRLGRGNRDFTPFGMKLPSPGQEVGEEIGIDWTAQAFAMLAGMPGSGKRHPLTTRVPVPVSAKYPSGWATIGDLEVNDEVFAADGSITTVDYLSPVVERTTYRITFSDGQVVEADAEHLWSVSDAASRQAPLPDDYYLQQAREDCLSVLSASDSASRTRTELAEDFGIDVLVVDEVIYKSGVPTPDGEHYPADEFGYALAGRFASRATDGEWTPRTRIVTTLDLASMNSPAVRVAQAVKEDRGLGGVPGMAYAHRSHADFRANIMRSGGMWTRVRESGDKFVLDVDPDRQWNHIVSVEDTTVKPGRCIRITHPEHLYLVEGFIPTHNTVTLNALIADAKSNGAELVIVDDQAKAVDFMWCRDLVRPGGWGCDSVEAAVATLSLVYEEGKRRAEILAEGGYVNWTEMPKGKQFTPIFIVVDEVSALLVTDKIPSGVPKDHPDVVELIQMNFLKFKLQALIGKIIAEQRFVGMRMVISTQVTNNTTGVPPSLKAKIGHKILQGVNPSKNARVQAFSDEAAVPYVPANVRNGGSVARGVGVADLEGDAPVVYKSYFATTGDYRDRLISLGARPIRNFAPTPAQIAKYAPDLNEEFDDGGFDSGLDGGGWGEQDGRDKPEPKLRGAAAAAHALKVEAAAAAR